MSKLPKWLTALQFVRETQRDAARQSHAAKMRAVTEITTLAQHPTVALHALDSAMQCCHQNGPLDVDRMRQISECRGRAQSQIAAIEQRQQIAEANAGDALICAVDRQAELDGLRPISERLLQQRRAQQRFVEEKLLLESPASLCNDPCYG